MRFQVPQNIDMQDRIVGPLTMAQFVYAIVGAGLTYGAYTSLVSPINLMVAAIIAMLTFAIIFVKINEQPFLKFAAFVLQFLVMPKKMIWHQASQPGVKVQFYVVKKGKTQLPSNAVSSEDIYNLANKIDAAERDKVIIKR